MSETIHDLPNISHTQLFSEAHGFGSYGAIILHGLIKDHLTDENHFSKKQRLNETIDTVVDATQAEAGRREAHQHRYYATVADRAYFSIGPNQYDHIPKKALRTYLENVRDGMLDNGVPFDQYSSDGTKGASAEIGHVTQLGKWSTTHDLDAAMRALPERLQASDPLVDISKIYDSNLGDYRYDYYRLGGVDDPVVVARKRPVMDLATGDRIVEVIKRSTFVVIPERIAQKTIRDFIKDAAIDHSTEASKQIAGKTIIEATIHGYKERKYKKDTDRPLAVDPSVLPIEALYFALLRKKAS